MNLRQFLILVRVFLDTKYPFILIHFTQMLTSPKSGMTRRMASGLHLRFPTPSVKKLLAAASGNGNEHSLLVAVVGTQH